MKTVEDLDVFKLAHQLALKTYSVTKRGDVQSGRPDEAGSELCRNESDGRSYETRKQRVSPSASPAVQRGKSVIS
jgi:hypothetical protein